jgi:hypothetical protein
VTIVFAVPARTKVAICKAASCRKQIYWITTGSGKHMPIDCNVEGGKPPTGREPGHGVPHWATCPEAGTFKRAKS